MKFTPRISVIASGVFEIPQSVFGKGIIRTIPCHFVAPVINRGELGMRKNSKLRLVLAYVCVTSASLAFVRHSGAGCASLRPKHYLQPWASSIAQQPHRCSFTGSTVICKRNAPGLRRGWKSGIF